MKTSDIQKILQQQKELSPIKGLTPAEINRKIGASAGAEAKRKVPVEDYNMIIKEYWDNTQPRPLNLYQTIASRYNVKEGVIEKITMNFYDSMDDAEYAKLRGAYENKFGRSELLKQMHAEGRRNNVAIGDKISKAKQTLTDEQAREIYQRYLPYKNQHGATAFQKQLAQEYGVTPNKIRMTCCGYHPALNGSRDGVKR